MNAIDKFITKEIVFEKSEFKGVSAIELIDLFNEVKNEIGLYISNLPGVDSYDFSLRLPVGSDMFGKKGNPNVWDNDTIQLPYGNFSLKLFQAMKADGDNCPVFKLVNFFSEKIDKLCKLLIKAGVLDAEKPDLIITRDMLNSADVIDFFCLHNCITIYFNFFKED